MKHADTYRTLMREAAKNLSELMDTPKAEQLQVRHFLPDELEGAAYMLEDDERAAAATAASLADAQAEIARLRGALEAVRRATTQSSVELIACTALGI